MRGRYRSMPELAMAARLVAQRGSYNGLMTPVNQAYIAQCRHIYKHAPDLLAMLIFTRDFGMHGIGWWKNPDYERCYHLSLSFQGRSGARHELLDQDHKRSKAWCEFFFGDNTRYLWVEPPYSAHGHAHDIWHYRLFMAPDWRTPILPRKEVYSREFTEAGWKSWSDIHPPGEYLDAKDQP
jgi:hypothetical protein